MLKYVLILLTAAISLYIAHRWHQFNVIKRPIEHIPTIGGDHFITAYLSSWRYMLLGHKIVQEGYVKYNGAPFKIPTFITGSGWLIVVSGIDAVEDMRKASTDVLSFHEYSRELIHSYHLLPPSEEARFSTIHYHIDTMRISLTRHFPSRFDDVVDEMVETFRELIPPTANWKAYSLRETMQSIVCRMTQRLFVGLPLCRDPEYCQIQKSLVVHSFAIATLLSVIPPFLRPLAGRLLSRISSSAEILKKSLGLLIEERLENERKLGQKWNGRPNDLISWLLDNCPDSADQFYRTVKDILIRIIFVNFAAIPSTTIAVSTVILDLASAERQEKYLGPLRQEVEEAIRTTGWTKDTMGRLELMDSFIKESNRLLGGTAVSLQRKVLEEYKFSNGFTIPAGYSVAVATFATHRNDSIYPDAASFQGFRFAENKKEGQESSSNLKNQLATLNHNYLLFGHGRHACPGRFFVVNELKAIMAYIIMNYDFKLEGDANKVPDGHWFAGQYSPNHFAKVMFRKRSTSD